MGNWLSARTLSSDGGGRAGNSWCSTSSRDPQLPCRSAPSWHLVRRGFGGNLCTLVLLHTGLFLGLLTVPLLAFAGALLATAIVLGVSRVADATSADCLVLASVAVSLIIMAAANGLIFLGDPRASHTVVFWMLGGLGCAIVSTHLSAGDTCSHWSMVDVPHYTTQRYDDWR